MANRCSRIRLLGKTRPTNRAWNTFGVLAVALATMTAIPSVGSAQAPRKTCVDCHGEFKQILKRKHVHSPAKESCEKCHERHGFTQKLVLVKNPPDLCVDCHSNIAGELAGKNVHKALSEGGCTVCHDPHASDEPALMRDTDQKAPACVLCHTELSDMLSREDSHEPFRKGKCASCHKPHSSDLPALLADKEGALCETCHEGATAEHDIANLGDFACSDCHDPHGASKKVPVAKYAHEPFASGECESCHKVEAGGVSIEDGFPRADLCADCHDDKTGVVTGAESHFGIDPVKAGGTSTCLKCHAPHTSRVAGLMTAEQKDVCLKCHKELQDPRSQRGSVHAPYAGGECSACHEPHGGGGEHRLAKEPKLLCAGCHEDKAREPREGEIRHEALGLQECIDCHSGHVSDRAALLKTESAGMCGSCHEQEKHSKVHPPYASSNCQVCHKNHSSGAGLLASSMTDVCARCHNEQVQKISAAVAHPPAKDNPCTMCHAPHGAEYAGLLNSPEATLCDSCHGLDDLITKKTGADSKAIAGEPLIHKPVADRKCGECHDPHGSNAKGLLVRQGERLCYGCHTQEKISFADGNSHKPVAEGKCGACHAPHGTDGTDLVKTDEKVLCTQCHDLGTPTALAAHRRFDVANAKCTICHDPHVSKGDHLLKRYTHKPFTEGSCESCHEDGGGKAAGQVSPGACVTCHDGKPAEKGHQQMAGVACADCHAPHASSYEALLLNPAKLCAGCHADVIRPKGQEAGAVHLHRPVQDGSCMACHEMHEPKAANLLAEPPRQLCGGCHETIKARANHLTQHEPFRKEQCSSCHSTHASTEKHLMKAGESAVCGSCHKPDDQKMKVAHKRVPPSGDTCTSCHDPHSTAAKGSALVRRVRHAPYEENDCSVCHAETGKPSLSLSTCLECHDSADRFAAVHTGGHASKEGSQVLACLDCHSPHAGYKGLLPRESQTQTCMQCHDRNEFSRRFVHEALSDGCTTCHDVHKENMKELKGPAGIALCTQCHDAAKTHSHPYGEKYTDPRDNGPLTCTSCHMPHSSDHEFMLQFDRNRDLCVQCHLPGTMKVH